MILIISSQEANLNSSVDSRFGRAQCLIKVDTESDKWEALPNSGVNQRGGAGVAAAQIAINHKAETVISGDFGPNAAEALKAAGINMALFGQNTATVQEAVDNYKLGKLTPFG